MSVDVTTNLLWLLYPFGYLLTQSVRAYFL